MLLLAAVKSGDFLSVCVSLHTCLDVRVLLRVRVCDLVWSVAIMDWVYGG